MKLLATDYDGTLCQNYTVSEENIKQIKAWREAGNYFGIVTGRSSRSILNEIHRYALPIDFLIANNGGVVYDEHLETMRCQEIVFEEALKIIDYVKQQDIISYVINDGFDRAKVVVNSKREDLKYGTSGEFKTVDELLKEKRIAQIVVSLDSEDMAKTIKEYIDVHFKESAEAYINVNCVDIVPLHISKADGLHLIQEHFHLKLDDVYTIGDAYNDVSMLLEFHGACVERAPKEIQEQLNEVYPDVASYIQALLKRME